MDYIDLLNNLDEKKIKNINLLYVSEPYFLELSIENLKKDLVGEDFLDFNFEKIDFEKLEISDFESIVETLPLMSKKRLVIVENCVFDKNKIKKYEDILLYISKLFPKFNETTYLFFIYEGPKLFKGKFIKSIEKYGDIYTFERLDKTKFSRFIGKYFSNNKIKIDTKSINFIADRLRYLDRDSNKNLYEVENELSKLVNNIKSKTPTFSEIEESIIDTFEEKIFGLLDFISKKDVKKSILAFKSMQTEDKFMIYYMIIRQIRNLICVKDCQNKRLNLKTTQLYCGIGPFEYNKLSGFINGFKLEDLLKIHELCFESEKNIKTSKRNIEDLIERIIFEFCVR